jgi:hypothetical protein
VVRKRSCSSINFERDDDSKKSHIERRAIMNLGCKLGIDSFSGQAERLESDGQLPLFFTFVIEGLMTPGCELRIPPDYALRLTEGPDPHAGISRSVLDLSVPVCLRVAAANLAGGEIECLTRRRRAG